jgi:Family of unknown function (DUF5995)
MFPYDATLLGLTADAPKSVEDVLGILQAIESTCSDADGLKWFNWLYLQVTQAVATRVTTGGFADPPWLAQLDVHFAALYFSALRASLCGQTPPRCWQVLMERRSQTAIARIQFAAAGVNAHINHDLPEAILATCRATGTTPDHGSSHYNDYTALNTTLDGLIESAKSTLRVRLPGDALPPVTHLEDTIAAWKVTAARESAWLNSEHLWRLRTVPALSNSFTGVLDGLTAVIGKTLLVPVP